LVFTQNSLIPINTLPQKYSTMMESFEANITLRRPPRRPRLGDSGGDLGFPLAPPPPALVLAAVAGGHQSACGGGRPPSPPSASKLAASLRFVPHCCNREVLDLFFLAALEVVMMLYASPEPRAGSSPRWLGWRRRKAGDSDQEVCFAARSDQGVGLCLGPRPSC
jgi:hypothetical protein